MYIWELQTQMKDLFRINNDGVPPVTKTIMLGGYHEGHAETWPKETRTHN